MLRVSVENHNVIGQQYFFPKMKSKISAHIHLCKQCLENKYERNPYKIKYGFTPIPRKPLDILHIDIFISKPDLFISAMDKLSRFEILIPIKSRAIPNVKRGMVKLISACHSAERMRPPLSSALWTTSFYEIYKASVVHIHRTT